MYNSQEHSILDSIPKKYYVWYEDDWKHEDEFHSHQRAQLAYVAEGYQHLFVDDEVFLLPQNHAVWIPPNKLHKTKTTLESIRLMTIFFELEDDKEDFYNEVRIFSVPTVLKEMLFYASKWSKQEEEKFEEQLFLKAILYEMPSFWTSSMKLGLTVPKDDRLYAVCVFLQENFSSTILFEELAQNYSMSLRTMERLFKKETGLTASKYLQLIRIIRSIEFLGEQKITIAEVAYKVGYKSLQAFSNSFYQLLQVRPNEFVNVSLQNK